MIMKIKSFMMMVAGAAFMMSVSSCSSSNNDEPEVPLASQVVGSYTGQEILLPKISQTSSRDPSCLYITYSQWKLFSVMSENIQ